MDPLTKLAIQHGTDKWGPHFYTPVYHSLFSHWCEKSIRLLEIGIGGYGFPRVGGASLAMWADYFPNGKIVGVDIAEKDLSLGPRVTLRQGSQDDPTFLERVSNEFGPFDIIIDDGSHIPAHVVESFNTLFPLMADGGFYVIEDVQTSFWPQFGGSFVDSGRTIQLAKSMLDHLNYAEIKAVQPDLKVMDLSKRVRSLRAYHNIVVIEKGDNNEPSNADFHLGNHHAADAIRMIEGELNRLPTPEGCANLIEVYTLGRDYSKALALAEKALAQWQDHPTLLMRAFLAAKASGDSRKRRDYALRLARVEGNTLAVQEFVR